MKPLAIDLCCGRGGWTNGLLSAGYDVIGFDVVRDPLYRADLVLQDIRTLDGARFSSVRLIVASPPCQEFSYRDLPFGRVANLDPPDLSIVKACFRISMESQVRMVLENVRGLQKWFRPAERHYGPYYLWGDVPALLPISDRRSAQKGLSLQIDAAGRRTLQGPRRYGSKSPMRKNWTATASMIPFELAKWIGECFA